MIKSRTKFTNKLFSVCKGRTRIYKPEVFHTSELAKSVCKIKGFYLQGRHEHPVSEKFIM